ncbi:MAG: hypothetical protein MJ250_01915 [Alphaproteobacteria bacterium]|nr:hypothetical protein [Alphaproteobacteria bacterium]
MSDKLEWRNRHFALLRCKDLKDAVDSEKYVCRPDLKDFYKKNLVEDVIWDFADAGRYKCATELMGYVGHHRAVVWWAYQCALSLMEELEKNPAPTVDIDNIGKSFEPEVPDFAKVEIPKITPEQQGEIDKNMANLNQKVQELRAKCDPELLGMADELMDTFYQEFKKVHGYTPLELIDLAGKKYREEIEQGNVDRNSPIFKECEKIKAQLQNVRKETLDTIHTVLPPELPEVKKEQSLKAIKSVYNWILAPDEINAKICLDCGNACPDAPAGILAYCAFWAWGDMLPGEKTDVVVKTPAGLMSNGISQFLLMCALHKGGTRKLKERYAEYFRLGVDVLTGRNLWDEAVISGEVPHEKFLQENENSNGVEVKKTSPVQAEVKENDKKVDENSDIDDFERKVTQAGYRKEKKYTRWKPE